MNVAADPMSRASIRKLTKKLRELAGCDKREFFPIVRFIEWILANPDNGIDLEIVDPDEMQDTYGTTNTGSNIMRIRSDVYDGAVKGDPRHRFTLCHEVGHYFLHQPDSVSFARGKIPIFLFGPPQDSKFPNISPTENSRELIPIISQTDSFLLEYIY